MQLCGVMEVKVSKVGLIVLHVVKNLPGHQCILGWDMLDKFGFSLDTEKLAWGDQVFKIVPYQVRGVVAPIKKTPQDSKLQAILEKYKGVFGEPNTLKQANVPAMDIITDHEPIHQRPYRTALAKRQAVETQIDKMLETGVIRPSCSPWASPVCLVPKKDGELRFCVDYRQLNSVTKKDRYPLPFIQDVFDQLGGATKFSTLDMRSGYHQVGLTPEAMSKTAFVSHKGQYEFTRVPFGLCNAPSHYQRVMNQVLAKHIGKRVMVFLDDIVVYSSTEPHEQALDLVLADLEAAGLTLKESKCFFLQDEIDLLGYVISSQGIKAQPSKTSAIDEMLPPTDINGLRRYLGMCSYYRQLVPGFATLVEPLLVLTRKDVAWHWGPDQNEAFLNLKKALVSDAVMAHPQVDKPYILYTDACDYAIGAILTQEDDSGI